MSRWALTFSRDGAPVDGRALARMAAVFGTRDLRLVGTAGFAGTVAASDDGRHLALFSGRLDAADDLVGDLPRELAGAARRGPGELVLAAYQAWGQQAFQRFVGPFALALYDLHRRRLVLTRDALGQRLVAYYCDRRRLVAATDDDVLLAHPSIPQRLDDDRIAAFLAQRGAHGSFFHSLCHVEPGEVVTVELDRARRRQVFALTPEPTLLDKDEDLAERFRHVLSTSVADRLAPPRREESSSAADASANATVHTKATPAILLSGGLDSSAITVAAAHNASSSKPLLTVSWGFAASSEASQPLDESSFRRQLARHLAHSGITLDPLDVPCAAAGPFANGVDAWPLWPETPEQSPYRLFHQRAYAAAAARGATILLTGFGGDQLYSGAERWLRDLVRDRQPGRALAYLAWLLGSGRILRPGISRAVASALAPEALLRWRRGRTVAPPWLTPLAARAVEEMPTDAVSELGRGFRRPEQARTLLDPSLGRGFALEARIAEAAGLTVRNPFRDVRWARFMLRLPTAQLFADGVSRPILRRALAEQLPAAITRRRRKASFEPIFRNALAQPAAVARRRQLARADRLHRWVDPDWLTARSQGDVPDGSEALALWHCLTLDLWLERREGAPAEISRAPEPRRAWR